MEAENSVENFLFSSGPKRYADVEDQKHARVRNALKFLPNYGVGNSWYFVSVKGLNSECLESFSNILWVHDNIYIYNIYCGQAISATYYYIIHIFFI